MNLTKNEKKHLDKVVKCVEKKINKKLKNYLYEDISSVVPSIKPTVLNIIAKSELAKYDVVVNTDVDYKTNRICVIVKPISLRED